MEAREKLNEIGCTKHNYLGDGVYCGVDFAGQIWLIAERENGWHEIALDTGALAALFRYATHLGGELHDSRRS